MCISNIRNSYSLYIVISTFVLFTFTYENDNYKLQFILPVFNTLVTNQTVSSKIPKTVPTRQARGRKL